MITIKEWVDTYFGLMLPTAKPVIVELGAHRGEDTAWLCKVHPGVTVHAFEPDPPRPLPKLPGVVWHHCAVGNQVGHMRWWRSTTRDGIRAYRKSSSLLQPTLHLTHHPEVQFDAEERWVQVTTLDRFADEFGIDHVDFIWMDVQGAERMVFEGGRKLLARTDWLYTEATEEAMYGGAPSRAEIITMLEDWRVAEGWPHDLLFQRRT